MTTSKAAMRAEEKITRRIRRRWTYGDIAAIIDKCIDPEELEELEYEKTLLVELLRCATQINTVGESNNWDECARLLLEDIDAGKRGIELTGRWEEHPERFDVPCVCKLCRSYGD
jgi:hypothetical protein